MFRVRLGCVVNRRVSLTLLEIRVLGWFRIRVLIEMVLQLRVLFFSLLRSISSLKRMIRSVYEVFRCLGREYSSESDPSSVFQSLRVLKSFDG